MRGVAHTSVNIYLFIFGILVVVGGDKVFAWVRVGNWKWSPLDRVGSDRTATREAHVNRDEKSPSEHGAECDYPNSALSDYVPVEKNVRRFLSSSGAQKWRRGARICIIHNAKWLFFSSLGSDVACPCDSVKKCDANGLRYGKYFLGGTDSTGSRRQIMILGCRHNGGCYKKNSCGSWIIAKQALVYVQAAKMQGRQPPQKDDD